MLEDEDLVSIEEVRAKAEKPYAAWLRYRLYNQEQIDSIVERMAAAATSNGPCNNSPFQGFVGSIKRDQARRFVDLTSMSSVSHA